MYQRFTSKKLGLIATLLFFGAVASTHAAGFADSISVNDPYVRAVPPVVKTTAAFMKLQNSDSTEHFVVDASSPAAAAVELHMHIQDDGVMRMRRIAHIHLPPNQTATLQPGGLHIMLFDLQQGLKEGDEIPITLTFDDGSTKDILAPVRTVQRMMMQ